MSKEEDDFERLIGQLAKADTAALDCDAWAARARVAVAPVLERRAARAFRRRVAGALVAAMVPLPAIVAYDRFVLELLYGLADALLPQPLPMLAVGAYGLTALLLLGATYAAIPVLVERTARGRRLAAIP